MSNMDEMKSINRILDKFQYKVDRHSLLSDLFSLSAITISNAVDFARREDRQREFEEISKRYSENDQMLLNEAFQEIVRICTLCVEAGEFNDWLGELYMHSGTSSSKAGQFFTPFNLSRLCASMQAEEAAEKFKKTGELITVDEPACGSGGMILAFMEALSKKGINYATDCFVHAADLDSRCVKMCYVQLSLAGIPAVIHQRDTLSMKTFDEWCTPAYLMQYLKFRKFARGC